MYICTHKYFEAMAEMELNQIKLVIIEHKKPTNGLPDNLAETKQSYLNGVVILHSQASKLLCR